MFKRLLIFVIVLINAVPLFSSEVGSDSSKMSIKSPEISPLNVSLKVYTLDSLMSSLKRNNAEIIKSQEEISKSKLDVLDAKSGYYPKIDLTVSGSYIANPIDPIRINLGDYVNLPFSSDYVKIYNGMENMYYTLQLELTQPIFTWGKLDNAVKLYEQIYDMRVLEYTDVYEKALTELRVRLVALYYLEQIKDILEKQKEISINLVSLSDSAYENGVLLKTEALNSHVKSMQINVAYEQVNKEILQMKSQIFKLTGVDDLSLESFDFNEDTLNSIINKFSLSNLDYCLSEATSDERVNLKLLYALNNLAEYSKKIAQASVNWKPDLALVIDAGYSGSRLPFIETDWSRKDDWNAVVTVALKTTVFDGGKAIRNVTRAKSDLYQSQVNTVDNKALIRNTVVENYSSMNVSLANISYLNASLEHKEAEINVSKSLFDSGYGSEAEYLSKELEKNTIIIELLQEKINLYTSVYTLQYLVGGAQVV